jgi:hypothetical protein
MRRQRLDRFGVMVCRLRLLLVDLSDAFMMVFAVAARHFCGMRVSYFRVVVTEIYRSPVTE